MYKQLRRSRSDRMVAGVSGGLGRYFDVNPVLYRVGFVVLALLGGAGLLIYLAAALVIPDEGRDESIVEQALRERRARPWRIFGLGLVVLSAIVLLAEARLWDGHFAWIFVLVAGIVLLSLGPSLWTEITTPSDESGVDRPAAQADRSSGEAAAPTPPSPPPPSGRSFAIGTAVLGVLVVAAAILGILAATGVDIPWAIALGVAAGAVGVTIVAGAILGLRVGWLVVIGLVLGAAAIFASTINLRLGDGIGDRRYAPVTAAGLRDEYELGIGELELDLTRLELVPGTTERVNASLGIGHLIVTLPEGVGVRIDSHVEWGDSDVLGTEKDGHDVHHDVDRPGAPGAAVLELDLDVGVGQVEVTRAVR
jgi:phage shock protein PspC (stress-responsive transcriptional regulator)